MFVCRSLKVFEKVCNATNVFCRKRKQLERYSKVFEKVFKSISKGVRHDSQKIKDLLQYLKGAFKNKSVHTVQRIKYFRRQRKQL